MTRTRTTILGLAVVFGLALAGGCNDGTSSSGPIFGSEVVVSDSGGDRPFGITALSDGALAVTHQEATGMLSILDSNGDGTFRIRQQIPTDALAPMDTGTDGVGRGIVPGDFDGDGDLDLVMSDTVELDTIPLCENVPNARRSNIIVFLNDGGTFTVSEALTGGLRAQTPAVGDVDGDGNLDIVIDNRHGDFCAPPDGTVPNTGLDTTAPNVDDRRNGIGNAQVFLGNGDGTFDDNRSFGACTSAHFLAMADFNADGFADVAMPCNIDQGQIAVLFGSESGALVGQVDLNVADPPTTVPRPHGAKTADLNGDGNMDVVVSNTKREFPAVSAFLGDGAGGFTEAPTSRFSLGADLDGLSSSFLDVADITGPDGIRPDGIPDLVVGKNTGDAAVQNFIVILAGDGSGGFTHVTNLGSPFAVGPGINLRQIVVADFNGDGSPDVATEEFGSSDPIRRNIVVLLHR